MKKIFQILGIIIFFSLIGFALTYPYELAYKGTEDIKLIEESYEYTSLEQVTNRPEFKGKVLFIRVGGRFESERVIPDYVGKEENKIIIGNDGEKYIIHSKSSPNNYQLNALSEMRNHYKGKEVEMIYLIFPYGETNQKEDNLRIWKSLIKKYPTKGYHLIISKKLYRKIRGSRDIVKNGNYFFPYNLITNKYGSIIEYDAPSPIFEKEKLYVELDSILKQ